MNPDHPRFAQWDAAYVVGALSQADRRDFEQHLAECADCRRAVAELSPAVGLLSRLTPEDAERIDAAIADDGERDDAGKAAEILSFARIRARSRRRLRVVALVAAAVLIIAAVAVPFAVSSFVRPAVESFALQSVVEIPLEASVRLTPVDWGTRIELDCRYPTSPDADPDASWIYALAVVDTAGEASTVSTWRAGPGSSARLSAGTALDVDHIRGVEIRAMNGTVLMSYDLDQQR
jgi:putative zinc finger protein